MTLIKYWKPLLAAALLLLLAAAWRLDRTAQYRAGEATATARISAALAKQATAQQTAAHKASTEYQAEKATNEQKEKIRYVEVQKIINRPVYRNVCLDSDGLHIINQAIADGH